MVVDNYLFSGKLFENDVYVGIHLYPFEILEQLFAISLLDQVINLFFLFFYLNYYFFLSFFFFLFAAAAAAKHTLNKMALLL